MKQNREILNELVTLAKKNPQYFIDQIIDHSTNCTGREKPFVRKALRLATKWAEKSYQARLPMALMSLANLSSANEAPTLWIQAIRAKASNHDEYFPTLGELLCFHATSCEKIGDLEAAFTSYVEAVEVFEAASEFDEREYGDALYYLSRLRSKMGRPRDPAVEERLAAYNALRQRAS